MTVTSAQSLRKARVADAAALARIHKAGFPAFWTREDFAEYIRQPEVSAWMAGSGDDSGFIVVRRADEEAEILTFAVAPAVRRQGIGRALLEHSMTDLRRRGVAILFLEVAAGNVAAEALYERMGFKRCGTRRNYYPQNSEPVGKDAVVMRCDL